MLKRIKLKNSTILLIGLILILLGVSIGFIEYFNQRKDDIYSEMNILLYENEIPENIESEEIVEEESNIIDVSTDNVDNTMGVPYQSSATANLNSEYTFDNFIEGASNKFAKAACYAVAREPCYCNPLFIYGHSGLGKTHLLYAIMNYMSQNHKDLKIIYKKSETFLNELVEALTNGKQAEFKEKYRTADVLLIDDIQFIAGKPSTQEEFFHTFSVLYENEKQIILTSDRPPMEIKPLTDRLRTRFEGGLIADVQPPSLELRTAIVKKKCNDIGLSMNNEDLNYIAERLNSNIRQIEGVLKRLHAINSLTGAATTREKIDEIISIVDPGNIPNEILVDRIVPAVSRKYGVSADDIRSKKKTDNIAGARHIAIYLTRELTDLSLEEIGKTFGRDHATVMYSINKVKINIRTIKNYESDINTLKNEIKS